MELMRELNQALGLEEEADGAQTLEAARSLATKVETLEAAESDNASGPALLEASEKLTAAERRVGELEAKIEASEAKAAEAGKAAEARMAEAVETARGKFLAAAELVKGAIEERKLSPARLEAGMARALEGPEVFAGWLSLQPQIPGQEADETLEAAKKAAGGPELPATPSEEYMAGVKRFKQAHPEMTLTAATRAFELEHPEVARKYREFLRG